MISIIMIGIIAGYRTGSTTLIHELSVTQNLTYKREYTGELDFYTNPFSYPAAINQIYKIMPTDDNLSGETRELFYKHWLDNSSNLFYTVRHDLTAQIKSWALASISLLFHPFELSEVRVKHLDTDSIHVSMYNYAHNTEFETIRECQSHIDSTFTESLLLSCKGEIISTMQNQYEIYRKYKGTVCWLETREKTNIKINKKYPMVFSLPAEFASWHCGSVGEQHFKQ
jgi:hypothetical protein